MPATTDFDPIFIIGDHRSGTTVLYQALASTGAFSVVTAYHVIRHADVLADFTAGRTAEGRQGLAEEFARLGLSDRGIDGVAVTPDLPEEYGFIIDRRPRPNVRPETLPALVDLCRLLRRTGGNRPLLLKNPWDILTFDYVKAQLPRAKLIFMHRHPLRVMSSQLAATRSLMRERNDYVAMLAPWYGALFKRPVRLALGRLATSLLGPRIVGRHAVRATRHYMNHIESIPRGDRIEVRYEDFCTAPDMVLQRILAFLNVPSGDLAHLRALVQPRRSHVLPEVRARFTRIRPALVPYCERHGYDLATSMKEIA